MRIAQVAPLAEAVPPKLYGGTERVVSWLTEALVDLGHEVTLFASGDSATRANLHPVVPEGLRLAGMQDPVAQTILMLDAVRRRANDFDIIHFHVDCLQFPMFQSLAHKCVTTLHGRIDMPQFAPLCRAFPTMPLVTISEHQKSTANANLNWAATIYHGMPAELFTHSDKPGRYLAFLGRISPEKRPDRAIAIAQRAGMPLKIAAKVDRADQEYFSDVIQPLLGDPLVEFIGEINGPEKARFLQGASALLFPIDWPEPFGLVMIEAMASGTPVVAWREGSVPEIIDEGITGFVVDSIDAAVSAVMHSGKLDRRGVRDRFEARFTDLQMTHRYVDLYQSMAHKAQERSERGSHAPGTASRLFSSVARPATVS